MTETDVKTRKADKPRLGANKLTRQAQLRKLLTRKSGVSIAQLHKTFGWQPHTARAAISAQRKSGCEIARSEPSFAGRLCSQSGASDIACLRSKLTDLTSQPDPRNILMLVKRIEIAPGQIKLKLDPQRVAVMLDIGTDTLVADLLRIDAPFQIRKRGVETKIILADTPADRDEALIRNIALAHHWLERIKAGETFGDIARTDDISKRRVQHMIDLAFLAPDIIRDVLMGKQPLGFTSDWCEARTLPSDWRNQRELLSTL